MRHVYEIITTSDKKTTRALLKRIIVVVVNATCIFLSSKFKIFHFNIQTFTVVMISVIFGRQLALISLMTWFLLYLIWILCQSTVITFYVCFLGFILGYFAVPFIMGNKAKRLDNFDLSCRIFASHVCPLFFGAAGLACCPDIGIEGALIGTAFGVSSEIFGGLLSFLSIKVWIHKTFF